MSRLRLILVLAVVLLLLLVLGGAGAWYYLYGTNTVTAAELVPSDTVFFATIPNSADIVAGYQTSQLKTLVDSPNFKPVSDSVQEKVGDKNMDLIESFLPNLIGQSFIAVTHIDPDHPEKTGFVAALKPKPGLDNFDAFVEKLKSDYPDQLKDAKTGTGNVAGVDYQYIQGPGASDKICVAKIGGWVVTAWGEASLQDWLERYQKKSTTPSLAQNPDYQRSLARIGADSVAIVYGNYHVLLDLFLKVSAKSPVMNPALSSYLTKRLGALGAMAMGTHFENGEIVDRFSFLVPRQGQSDMGISPTPCAYETLNFTGPDTLFYAAHNVDWKKMWQNMQDQEQAMAMPSAIPPLTQSVQNWAQSAGLDFQHNILDALGSEVSVQMDWGSDTAYPEVGLFIKLDKPDDFQPVIKAIIDSVRKSFANQAVINELNNAGHNFASLKFVTRPVPFTPTITEDGPYFGLFLTDQQAVRSFQRTPAAELSNNKDFMRQIGDKRNGSAQVIFLDSPRLLDRTYRTVMPYISMAAMFNQTIASALKGHELPPDLTWLAPIGTWSMVVSNDDDGLKGYSVSGVGNQGLAYGTALVGTVVGAQAMGFLPKRNALGQSQGTVNVAPGVGVTGTVNTTVDVTTNAAPAAPTAPADSPTNAAPSPDTTTHSAPATPPVTAPPADTTSNATPSPATTNSDANPTTPAPAQTH